MDAKGYCKVCGAPLYRRGQQYCSKRCMGLGKQHYKICAVCGKTYPSSPANPDICCSKECAHIHRVEMSKSERIYAPMVKGRDEYFEEHSGEKHPCSKSWVICSPVGKTYECQNLMAFIREHPDLFDGTPKQAFDGFAKIKATAQGKRPKNKSKSWKGWTLISWGEDMLTDIERTSASRRKQEEEGQ